MKIGILTHPLSTNYGGLLQNYALQMVLKQLGHTPITFNYKHELPCHVKGLSFVKRVARRIKGERIPLRAWPTKKETDIISQNISPFIINNISTTPCVGFSELRKLSVIDHDVLIVGSDQVWRADRGHVERYFFSDFVNLDIPKIAYAASMGVEKWSFSRKETDLCRELVKKFCAVSVREENAVELCRQYLGVDATCVLDPTLLLKKENYESLILDNPPMSSCNSMMVYILDRSVVKDGIVKNVANELSLQPNSVMAKYHFYEVGRKGLSDCVFPSVEQWIRGFRDAQYVVTDSFHGMVFSVIFNKQFIAIANNRRGRARFSSFLTQFGLIDRLVDNWNDAKELLHKDIDFEQVNSLMDRKREKSIEFLVNSLK